MGNRIDVWKGQTSGGSNPTLDREGGNPDDENRALVPLAGLDAEGATEYVRDLALGTALHLELGSGRVWVYHGIRRIGWLDPASDEQVSHKLQKGGLVRSVLYSTGGLQDGGHAIVECRL